MKSSLLRRTLVLGIGFLAAGISGPVGTAAPPGRPPSILVVLTDDMATGDADSMQAVQDLLVRQGTSFSQFLTSTPLCCPSRTTLLRGQYAHNHGVLQNYMPIGGYQCFQELGHESSTVGTWMHDAGYRTAFIGKYLNGYPLADDPTHVPPGWDEWLCRGHRASFGYTLVDNGRLVRFGNRPEDYLTDVLSDRAADFLQRASSDDVPFLAIVATSAPHKPARPAPEDEGKFDGVKAPRPPSFDEEEVDGQPTFVQRRRPLKSGEVRYIDQLYRNRQESLQSVDRMVARLLGVLETSGRLEDTYVFFLSDNGFHMGEHRLMPGKVAPYNEDVRVPLLVRGPGVPRGASMPHLVGNTDLAPTFAAIAGIEPPSYVDGRSLLPLLGSDSPPTSDWRQAYLIEYAPRQRAGLDAADRYRQWRLTWRDLPEELNNLQSLVQELFRWTRPHGKDSVPAYFGVRSSRFTFVQYAARRANHRETEMYDDASDPYQMNNWNRFGWHNPTLEEPFERCLNGLSRASGADCRRFEDGPLPENQ